MLYTEKKEKKVSLTDFKLKCFSFRVHLHPANIGPSNLSFVRIYAQAVLTGFYGIRFNDIQEVILAVRQTCKFHVKTMFEKLSNLFHDFKSIESTSISLLLFRLKFLVVKTIFL